MQTKLTLRLDDHLVRQAKQHAKQTGCSVSQMVADYFAAIASGPSRSRSLSPKVAELMGALEGARVDAADYRAHLERKYL